VIASTFCGPRTRAAVLFLDVKIEEQLEEIYTEIAHITEQLSDAMPSPAELLAMVRQTEEGQVKTQTEENDSGQDLSNEGQVKKAENDSGQDLNKGQVKTEEKDAEQDLKDRSANEQTDNDEDDDADITDQRWEFPWLAKDSACRASLGWLLIDCFLPCCLSCFPFVMFMLFSLVPVR